VHRALSLTLLAAAWAPACAPATLEMKLRARIEAAPASAWVAVAYQDLRTGAEVAIRARERVHAASTMKLPVMMEVYRRAAAGQLNLDTPVRVENRFRSIVDGSEFALDPADDADPWPYTQLGREVPLRTLTERMIVRSSNLATNLIIELVGANAVTRLCRQLSAPDIEVLRGVEDAKAHAAGRDNTTTAHDLAVLLRALAERSGVAGADEMLDVLARQELNEGIPAGLPPGSRVAHKTGSFGGPGGVYHDAALVRPGGADPGYVLVVLTRGVGDEKAGARLVADLSTLVWQNRLRTAARAR